MDFLQKQIDDVTQEKASLRHQLDELEVKAQLNSAADGTKIKELLSMNNTLKKDLRASEHERKRLENLLRLAGNHSCSSLPLTLPSAALQSQKRRLQSGDAECGHKRLNSTITPNDAVTRSLARMLVTAS